MDSWLPSHPQFVAKFYVALKLKNGKKYEFEMGLQEARDTTMYIHGVSTEGRGTLYLYRTKSTTIKSWFANSGVIKRRGSNKRMHQTPGGAGDP